MTLRFCAPTLLLAGLLQGVLAAPLLAQSDATFQEGVELYLRGRAEEALEKFKEVLAENPSNEEAYRLFEQSGSEVFFLMLVKEGEYQGVAKRFLELARLGRAEKVQDEAAIATLVEAAMTGDYLARREALNQLSANHGEYGAAPFIAHLADADDLEVRVRAITNLNHLGPDAVLPLVAALSAGEDLLLQNAAGCLGAIGDARAVPALKRVYESADTPVVRDAASTAIVRIRGREAAALPSSTDLHIEAAEQYFRSDDVVVSPFETRDAVWEWDGSQVTSKSVPAFLRHLELAEQHCFAALHDARARARLLATYAAELAAADAMSGREDAVEVPEEMMAGLRVALAAGGARGLAAALTFALQEDAPHTAVTLIDAMAGLGASPDVAEVLRGALESPYKMVRYSAALVLAQDGTAGAPVVQALVSALGEDAIRTVLVIDPDDNTRNSLAAALQSAGMSVVSAPTGGLGFLRARSLPPKDLLIVRAGMSDVTVDSFVFDSDYRSSAAPLLLLADAESAEAVQGRYEGKGKVAGVLAEPVARESAIAAATAAMGDLNEGRALALEAAEKAARTLAHLPRESLVGAVDGLVASLGREEETVLIPVLAALGRAGATQAVSNVGAIFADSARSEEVRVAAADALAGIFAYMDNHPGAEVVDPLREAALSDASEAVRAAAGRALGAARFLSDEEMAAFFSSQRGA